MNVIFIRVDLLVGFNRTFMELKLSSALYSQLDCRVLIVPLWN